MLQPQPVAPESGRAPSPEEISAQLDRIIGSPKLQPSERLCRFLRFIVEKWLAGDGADLKEYSIATIVYGRPSSFDPKIDSIVRVEASRLRTKLREYYETEGERDPVLIDIPKGAYLPAFVLREAAAALEEPESKAVPIVERRFPITAGALLLLGVLLGGIAYWRVPSGNTAPTDRSDLSAIAVLPFVPLNGSDALDDASRGLAEEIAHHLTLRKQLRVAGPASAAGRDTLPQLRRNLKVGTVLVGSVRREGGGVRINAQLVSTLDGYHLWSASYQREKEAEPQGDLAKAIAGEVAAHVARLSADAAASAGKEREALNFFRLGSYLLDWNYDHLLAYTDTRDGMPDAAAVQSAIQYFEKAVASNPRYARAHAALAHSYAAMDDGNPALAAKAKAAAQRAIQLDDGLASAHAVLGYLKFLQEWDFRGAEKELKRALELQPRLLGIYRIYADCASMLGHQEEAWAETLAGSALFSDSKAMAVTRGAMLFHQRRYQELEREARKLGERYRDYPPAHWLLGLALQHQGDADGAEGEFEEVLRQAKGDPRSTIALGHLQAVRGRRAETLERIARYREQKPSGSNAPYAIALLYAGLGDRDASLQWLDEAYRQRDNSLPYMKLDPRFDSIRSDPRFQELLRKLGL